MYSYEFPKRLGSSDFWSIQNKAQFGIEAQEKRLVFPRLQNHVESVRDTSPD